MSSAVTRQIAEENEFFACEVTHTPRSSKHITASAYKSTPHASCGNFSNQDLRVSRMSAIPIAILLKGGKIGNSIRH